MKNRADQGDRNLDFDGLAGGTSYAYNSKYQHKAAGIPDARANYGRGPTKGNTDSTTHTGKRPPASASGREQKRNPGGTREVSCPPNPDMIRYGRGPTKGNQQ